MLPGLMFSRVIPCCIKNLRSSRILLSSTSVSGVQTQANRWYTERANYVQVERDSSVEGLAWVRMDRKPVNSLNSDMMMELNLALENLENNESYRGAILTSANPGIFTAGLDITELYQRDSDYIKKFWTQLQNLWLKLYGSPLVLIAAINGNSPAGGLLMAMACDYRIMAAGKYTTGLNEVKLGMVAPQWLQDMMVCTIGQRQAEVALQLGTMFNPEEAQSIGLVDKVVPQESIESIAREEMQKWLKIPDMARVLTKQMLRNQAIEKFNKNRENECDLVSMFMSSGSVQKNIGRYMETLTKARGTK
ncbi:enoyl-CoA delta isomerase 1, mitochondrial-like [Amphiura filiformis]|uniref:enoyl-CoA delta isomerase 1, mitochondrial-like n=1 Tax=Amphiura filiformis TaxID=82378 RepID=UPI003B219292